MTDEITIRLNEPQASIRQGWEGGALLALALLLVSIGLSTLFSASTYLSLKEGPSAAALLRQIQGCAVGLVLMVITASVHYRRWLTTAQPMLALMGVVLLVLIIPGTESVAPVVKGARRWLQIGPVGLQPSEFAKLALLIWTARTLSQKEGLMHSFRSGLLPMLLVWGAVASMIALEPSVSAAALTFILAATLGFIGGARIRHYMALIALFATPVWVFVMSEPYRVRRILAFTDPVANASDASYQVYRALTAIGSGGLWGRGMGQSKMRAGFLPEPHNDFAIAVFGEEWGLLGMVGLLTLYYMLLMLGWRIAHRAPDAAGRYLAWGATLMLVLPAVFHFAINLSLMPPTGVSLPFVSYGRSSLMVNFAALGILMNIAAVSVHHHETKLAYLR